MLSQKFLLLIYTLTLPHSSSLENDWFCGESFEDASFRCDVACPTGVECPSGQFCFAAVSSCSTATASSFTSLSSSSSPFTTTGTITSYGHEAVEEAFLAIKDVINTELFLYETPDMQWLPSTVYRFDGFFDGLQVMYKDGVNGNKVYMGENDPACSHCHMYGIVNVAAFLAQAMKETIRYDACDENSWDRVGTMEMYPISNACGQLGQSYQDYHCKEEERFMECEVDNNMSIKAVTNAKWWGAPGPLFCGPKTQYPQTGYWDYVHECNNQWATPPEFCDVYVGQKGGKQNNDEPYPNAAGRTDVEGCCWWGRGVIQTSGVCNFGKLNYFLGKRAHDEGRESKYPDIDFCKDPEAICGNDNYKELKWIAGFFYWLDQVQSYENEGWNYINELHSFVDNGMHDEAFINSVSGIVNRGCHNPPCGTGELDGGPERADNFFRILKEINAYAWVDPATLLASNPSPPPQLSNPIDEPFTSPSSGAKPSVPYPVETPKPISPPTAKPTYPPIYDPVPIPQLTSPPAPKPTYPPISDQTPVSYSNSEPTLIRYTCGDGANSDSQTSIDVNFAYEIHNKIDVAANVALTEFKKSMLADIAGRLGCYEPFKRRLEDNVSKIVGILSKEVDGVDQDVAGCTVGVKMDTQTTCTPIKGGFKLFAESGTNLENEVVDGVKSMIEHSMTFGQYESSLISKVIYIGDRARANDKAIPASIETYSEPEPSSATTFALYGLIGACLVLLCLLCITFRSSRRGTRKQVPKNDEESAFDRLVKDDINRPCAFNYKDEPEHVIDAQNLCRGNERDSILRSQSQISRYSSRGSSSTRKRNDSNDFTRPGSRGSSKDSRTDQKDDFSRSSSQEGGSISFSRASTNESSDHSEARSFRPPPPRSNSTPIKASRRKPPPPVKTRDIQSKDYSSDERSRSGSEHDTSQGDSSLPSINCSADSQKNFPHSPMRANFGSAYFHDSQSNFQSRNGRISLSNDARKNESASALSKDERQKRLEAAKARAFSRKYVRSLT